MHISVIIPAYLAQRFLAQALDSVLSQTAGADEVLIVENFSPDETLRIARQLEHKHAPLVRVVRERRPGAGAARQRGILEAKGQWLAFLDADDMWLPQKLQMQKEAQARNPRAAMIHVRGCRMLADGSVVASRDHFPTADSWREDYLRRRFCICPSHVMLRRDVAMALGGFDAGLMLAEDTDLWLRVAAQHAIVPVDAPCVIHPRGHAESTMVRLGTLATHLSDLRVWNRNRRYFQNDRRLLQAWKAGYAQLFQLLSVELASHGRLMEAIIRYAGSCMVQPTAAMSPQGKVLVETLLGVRRYQRLRAALRAG